MKSPIYSRNDTDFLRFIAIVLIVNSHLDAYYPIPYIGTGGAIGNALFFMLSSFGLFLSYRKNPLTFKYYYVNRIRRIYPSVWIELVIIFIPFKIYIDHLDINTIGIPDILYFLGSFFYPYHTWFLSALMIYYALIFPIMKNYNEKKIYYSLPIILACYTYIYLYHTDLSKWCIEATYIRYLSYLLIFLFGVLLAEKNGKIKYDGFRDWLFLFFFISLIYIQKFLMSKHITLSLQFIQQLLLFPTVFYFLKVSRSGFIQESVMENRTISTIIRFFSNRTLQIYIVHEYFTIAFLSIHMSFPINIVVVLTVTLIVASSMKYISQRFILPRLSYIS